MSLVRPAPRTSCAEISFLPLSAPRGSVLVWIFLMTLGLALAPREWQTGGMATYKDIQRLVRLQAGFVPETCWIAHVLELNGCPPRVAHNRISPNVRQRPCPPDKRPAIELALRKLGRLPPLPSAREDTNQIAYRVVQEVIRRSER
jgi:hypothetical protein